VCHIQEKEENIEQISLPSSLNHGVLRGTLYKEIIAYDEGTCVKLCPSFPVLN
jgi:hypothetical protein